MLLAIILFSLIAFISACSPLALLNGLTPSSGYIKTADLSYAELPRQKLDVYVPANSTNQESKPVIIFFYGGSWESGSRNDYGFMADALTSKGFITVIPDYRIYPEVRFPTFVMDAAKATRWVKDNIAKFGGDPQRIFLMGHSAGAHVAAMLTLDAEYLKAVAMQPKQLRGMIGLAGPYDFLPLKTERLRTIFGPESAFEQSQPINFVNGSNPPMLLLTGDNDTTVNPKNSQRLATKIQAQGGQATFIEYENTNHTDILACFSRVLRGDGVVLEKVTEFIRQQ